MEEELRSKISLVVLADMIVLGLLESSPQILEAILVSILVICFVLGLVIYAKEKEDG